MPILKNASRLKSDSDKKSLCDLLKTNSSLFSPVAILVTCCKILARYPGMISTILVLVWLSNDAASVGSVLTSLI